MRISSKQGATMTPKCANLIRDMYKLVKDGFTIDEAKQYLELEGWRCDKGYLPTKGDWNKASQRIRMVQARRQAGMANIKGRW